MKKFKPIKYCIIAAGIVISAAFYIISGASDTDYSLYIDAEDVSGTAYAEGSGQGSTDGSGLGSVSTDYAHTGNEAAGHTVPEDGQTKAAEAVQDKTVTGISDELKDELELMIRAAVREELVSMSDEGYLEAAIAEAAEYSAAEAERRKGLVNINTADAKELMTLDGIGQKRADDIIAYRQQHGGFAEISDIMKVSGIKASSFEKIRDKICT